MKFKDIEDEQIKALVKEFYVYQSALIRTPLGQVGVNNQPTYPAYFERYNGELKRISLELVRSNIKVQEAKPPEESRSFGPTSFLQDFERQKAPRLVLVLDGQVIQPPEQLELIMTGFIERLATPWH